MAGAFGVSGAEAREEELAARQRGLTIHRGRRVTSTAGPMAAAVLTRLGDAYPPGLRTLLEHLPGELAMALGLELRVQPHGVVIIDQFHGSNGIDRLQ